jgi:hypothetical protein
VIQIKVHVRVLLGLVVVQCDVANRSFVDSFNKSPKTWNAHFFFLRFSVWKRGKNEWERESDE